MSTRLCPWCRTGIHNDCSRVACDCTTCNPEPITTPGDPMTAVPCPHCDRTCAGPAGLSSHIRSMHPEVVTAAAEQLDRDLGREAPPESAGLVWEDPPARGRRGSAFDKILELIPELRRNPGKWARLHVWDNTTGANSTQSKLRRDERVADCEFVARSESKAKTSALYGRYVEAE